MRIKYVIPTKMHSDFINAGMHKLLCQALKVHGEVSIVDSSPDIVHVFGIWSNAYAKLVEKLRSLGIPVVFTSINGMAELKNSEGHTTNNIYTRRALGSIAKNGATIHVCGNFEAATVSHIYKYASISLITNPLFTSTTNNDFMVTKFMQLYLSVVERNDKNIKESIRSLVKKAGVENKEIAEICSRIIYIQKRFIMENIPLDYLEQTSAVMISSDYDEKEMRKTLETLHISKFASYTMALLSSKAKLTEGFMPIESIGGKTVEKMEKVIIL